jgi:hypothetical protein
MSVYDRAAASAMRALVKFGRDLTVRNMTAPPPYDLETGTGGGDPVPSDKTHRGLFLPFGQGIDRLGGTMIEAGDVRCYLDGKADVRSDTLVIDGDGTHWRVVGGPGELNPAGTTRVLWDLVLRK